MVENLKYINMFSFLFSGIFNEPENYGGKIIGVATEFITIGEFCDVLNKVLAPRVFKVTRKKPVVSVLGSN
jgi:hypothetical protein